jgi:hypothetical protein
MLENTLEISLSDAYRVMKNFRTDREKWNLKTAFDAFGYNHSVKITILHSVISSQLL